MTTEYTYDPAAAQRADEAASRLEHAVPYVGSFKKASAITAKTGSTGIELEFDAPGQGQIAFSLYTRKADGTPIFGANFLNAFMFFFGLKSLKSVPGKVTVWDEEAKKRLEQDGEVYPELCNKPIGLVFQKELYTKEKGGGDGERLNLIGVFQPETRLMFSEVQDRKQKPEKLAKMLTTLRVKDTREKGATEAAQPSMGAPAGDY